MQRWANDAASRTRDRRVDFDNEVETRHITPSTETLSLGSDIVIDRPSVRQSSLEAMKIAERRRPKDRFDGITKGIDFNDHMRQFLQTVCTPNLASTERLTELKHWFAGRALTQVSQFLRSRDADSAFEKAIARLRKDFATKNQSAEDMLAGVLALRITYSGLQL